MLIPATDSASNAGPVPKPGEQMASEIQDETGKVLYRALYDLKAAPVPAGKAGTGLEAVFASEEWPDAAFKAALDAPPPQPAADADTVIKAVRLGWDILKDGRAVTDLKGASTAILNARNMNPMDYYEAKPGQSAHYYWWGYNWPVKSWKAFEVWVRVNGTYGAKAPADVPPGLYLPDIHVEFPHAPWAQWGLTMNGSAQVTTTSNVGKKESGIAYCQVLVTVTVSSIVDPSRPQPFKFTARGDNGFKLG